MGGDAFQRQCQSGSSARRDPRFLLFVGAWVGLNALFAFGSISIGEEAGQEIAWQAHIGGFFAGLLLFSLFDPVPRAGRNAADASSQDISDHI